MKKLSEMTLQELWQLFPIFLVSHDDSWDAVFCDMKNTLQELLKDFSPVRISHIGSTAIKGIMAKNIVDILVEVGKNTDLNAVATLLVNSGFIKMFSEEKRISFNMGYTEQGFADKVYHLHLRYSGDNDELYFRDYLNEHESVAKEYEKLKIGLAKKYKHDRNAYTDSKGEFIKHHTAVAKQLYKDRY